MTDYSLTATSNLVLRNADHVYIPNDPNNVDWQAYQTWLGDGNAADPYVPSPPSPEQQYQNAVAAGLKVTFTTSDALTATYAIDQQSQFNITAEMVSILTNGTFGTGTSTRLWLDASGNFHSFDTDQFKAFATAVSLYTNQLFQTMNLLQTGQQTTWPSNEISVAA